MAKKKFTSKSIPEVVYEVVGEKWMDKNTYLICFQTMTDVDGDDFHLEMEYHKDTNEIIYTRCYDHEVMEGTQYVSPCFKKQMEEYILQQVGQLRNGSILVARKIETELTLDVPLDMSINDFDNWLNSLKIEVVHTMTPRDEVVRILKIEKK